MSEFTEVKDSGKRQEFSTGSRRDTDDGKGWPHLVAGEPFNVILNKYGSWTTTEFQVEQPLVECLKELFAYSRFEETREAGEDHLHRAIMFTMRAIAETEDGTFNSVLRRLAVHYQNGAKKYAKNNWRKGQPITRYYDSAMRHLAKAVDGLKDEDHLAALLWNLFGIVQMKIDVKRGLLPPQIDDFPFTTGETFVKAT
jgi:hypothetical protein